MFVDVGNISAIEGFRDPTSDQPDLVRYRPAEGERVTSIVLAEGTGLSEALLTVLGAMSHHMTAEVPEWIESDSDGLTALLAEHWGLTEDQTTRPEQWGTSAGEGN